MGKKRETSTEEDSIMESPGGSHKKHKKHKKHKHKRHKDRSSEDVEVNVEDLEENPKPAIKLKIKIGGETFEAKSINKAVDGELVGDDKILFGEGQPWEGTTEPVFAAKKPGDETSDEEREWLEALEAGTLDDYGEVKKEKDPSLLTARQRALLHGNKTESLLELPSGYKVPELTEEQLQRRQQRAKKRREQAQQKQEKDKKQTLDRLLKKQEAKAKGKGRLSRKSHLPGFRYLNKRDQVTISVPQGFQFPLAAHHQQRPPLTRACGVYGCKNLKKYSCSKTGVPLCSLECYKKNLSLRGVLPPAVKT